MKPTKSSSTKYLLVVFLILIIFGIFIKFNVNFSKVPLLKSVNKVIEIKSDFSKLDTCIFMLYNAENNCRMYVISGEKKYYQQFTKEINEISGIMDEIENENQKEASASSESFDHLVIQKKIRTKQFIQLKKLADSLIDFSIHIDSFVEKAEPNNKLFTATRFKSIVKIDTIKPGTAARPKKKFFKRVFAAINDKGIKGTDTSKITLIKTTISLDSSTKSLAFNKVQLNAINTYYSKLYKINQKIKTKEKDLLDVNHQLILSIINGLKQYKISEGRYYTSVQEIVNSSTYELVKNLDKFTVFLGLLLIGLLVLVFYTIYSLFKNERALVKYSNKASLYAISKSRFLANMSHEIRTPLNSIVGFSEQLVQSNLEPDQKEQIGAIRNSSVMLLDVVNDILDFSKYETGKVTLESIAFSPLVAINDVFESMKVQAEKKKIGFVIDTDIEPDRYILGDPLRLKQVVMNLLNNAIKFTAKGSVTLTAKLTTSATKNALLKVSIIDTGIGINQIDQRIIFDEFAQVYYSSTKEKHQGTGLGLAICKKIVEFHAGKINVTSQEGKGSTFCFELPYQITEAPLVNARSKILPFADLELLKGKKALVADDNMLNILLATTILKKYDISFDAANDGKAAFELFIENDYDIILTDIQMPKMGGIELTNKIRAFGDATKAALPILGITANVMQEDRVKYLASGMDELILKPFLEREFIEKILKFFK